MVGNTASTPSEPVWLNTKTAAERLGITPRTLYRLVDEGLVVGYKVGRVIRFQEADVEAVKAEQPASAAADDEADVPNDGDEAKGCEGPPRAPAAPSRRTSPRKR